MLLPPELTLWVAVQVVPHHEFKVASQLRYKGHEEFLPTRKERHTWADRKKDLQRALFPGYVFCRTQRSSFGAVLGTSGVFRIVSFGGHPCPIPDSEIESLRQALVSGREFSSVPYLSGGEKVRVVQGPLAGLTGIVTRLKNRDRLVISVDLIMKSVSLDVALSELALLEVAG